MFFIINNQTVVYLTVVVLVFVGLFFFKQSINLIEIQNKEWKKKHTATH